VCLLLGALVVGSERVAVVYEALVPGEEDFGLELWQVSVGKMRSCGRLPPMDLLTRKHPATS
jgi:hypothetical protein